MPFLVLTLHDPKAGDTWVFSSDAQTALVGRDESSDVRIVRSDVSQVHGRFRRAGSEIFYTDLCSSNGTIMNGQPITPGLEITLAADSRLWFGEVRITVNVEGEPRKVLPHNGLNPNPFACLPTERPRRAAPVPDSGRGGDAVGMSARATGTPNSPAPPTPITLEDPIWSAARQRVLPSPSTQPLTDRPASPTNGGVPHVRDTDADLVRRFPVPVALPSAKPADRGAAPRPGRTVVRIPELSPGTRLGDYEIVKLIGRGGMGSVYEARHSSLRKPVAIKVLQTEFAKDRVLRERFFREAVAAAQLRNPYIVDVTHIDTDRGITYLVMELLRGENLATLISREGRLTVQQTIGILLPVCFAVHMTHRAGVIHRDLKPPNIFLHRISTGVIVPKVLDFGIMKLVNTQGPEANLTEEGELMGTPGYAAPEVLLRHDVDALTDLYSLGVILYECVTGRRPFVGDASYDIMKKVIEGNYIHPRDLLPELPVILDEIIVRLLNTEPSKRFSSVHELGYALLQLADAKRRAQWEEIFGTDSPAAGLSSPVGVSLPQRNGSSVEAGTTMLPAWPAEPRAPISPRAAPIRSEAPAAPPAPAPSPANAEVAPGRGKWLLLILVAALGAGITWLLAH
jgi:serine/threonine protein kinase